MEQNQSCRSTSYTLQPKCGRCLWRFDVVENYEQPTSQRNSDVKRQRHRFPSVIVMCLSLEWREKRCSLWTRYIPCYFDSSSSKKLQNIKKSSDLFGLATYTRTVLFVRSYLPCSSNSNRISQCYLDCSFYILGCRNFQIMTSVW